MKHIVKSYIAQVHFSKLHVHCDNVHYMINLFFKLKKKPCYHYSEVALQPTNYTSAFYSIQGLWLSSPCTFRS